MSMVRLRCEPHLLIPNDPFPLNSTVISVCRAHRKGQPGRQKQQVSNVRDSHVPPRVFLQQPAPSRCSVNRSELRASTSPLHGKLFNEASWKPKKYKWINHLKLLFLFTAQTISLRFLTSTFFRVFLLCILFALLTHLEILLFCFCFKNGL